MRKSLWLGMLAPLLLLPGMNRAQEHTSSDTSSFNKARFWAFAGIGTVVYTGASVLMWESWYQDYELITFHTFNDMGEWNDMDKIGHMGTAYNQSVLAYRGALWTGMDRRAAMWMGAGLAFGLQLTVELMDGFSEKWGFSWGDIAFNTLGIGSFVGQELIWEEQRIVMKMSSRRPYYPTTTISSVDGGYKTTVRNRAMDLYGNTYGEMILKDYNAMNLWVSVNIHSFLKKNRPQSRFPKWLNVAVGYGSENLYGGFRNTWWDESTGAFYQLDEGSFPRYRQFYLSFDVDLTRIPSKSKFVRTVFQLLNWIKIPSPTLEVNTTGAVRFHPIYW